MEQRTIRLNFDVSLVYGPRTWRLPLVALMLLCAVGDLSSESVTLSTYYPAPSGVYTNMITTGDTFLARDGGAATRVGIGTTAPTQKLTVIGNVDVNGGYVKINAGACGVVQTRAANTGALCTVNQYATFTPGVYVEGFSYQNRGDYPFVTAPDGTRRYTVWGTYGSNQTEMPLGREDKIQYVCCNR
ncbi:MAG: hypothetical protein HYX59_15860 [Elusimicrobia bacterium]|nr:hypothetical protein [Elusimicrobiota bacterium]